MSVLRAGLRRCDLVRLPRHIRLPDHSETRALSVALEEQTRIPTDSDFAAFLKGIAGQSDALIDDLAAGKLTPREWADAFKWLLNDGHGSAWVLGRRRAGDLSAVTVDDEIIGIGYGDSQADFLLGFLADLEGERYLDEDGNLIVSAVRARANLYVQVMRGTAGAAFVAVSDAKEQFEWVMGAVEDHCADCPELAEASPWDESTLFAFPGDGNTACLGNCKCHLSRASDGRTSFKPVSI